MNNSHLLEQLLKSVDQDFLRSDSPRVLREIQQRLDELVEQHRQDQAEMKKGKPARRRNPKRAAR